jgi:hypothetical protein
MRDEFAVPDEAAYRPDRHAKLACNVGHREEP